LAQGGELVEPFEIWYLVLEIFMILIEQVSFVNSGNYYLNNVIPYGCHRSDSIRDAPGAGIITDGSMG
jgi:hypothetical protein